MKFKSIRNIKIKTKLILLGVVSIAGLLLMGAESIFTSSQISQASTDISQSWLPSVIIAEELNTAISDYRIKEYNHVITRDDREMDRLEQGMGMIRAKIEAAFLKYENYIADETDRSLMEGAKKYWDKYLEYSRRLLGISREGRTEDALDLIIGESQRMFYEASNLFLEVVAYNRDGAERAGEQAAVLYRDLARVKVITACLISLAIALLVIYIIQAIDKPVIALVDGVRRISNGDLNVRLDYQSEDEIGVLTESMNQLVGRLRNIIEDEKYLFQEIGSENFEVTSSCQQAYRGDFAPILYSLSSLMSRLESAKEKQMKEELERKRQEEADRPSGGQQTAVQSKPVRSRRKKEEEKK